MKIRLRHLPLACVLLFCSQAVAQDGQSTELDVLREEIRIMRTEYEARIADLEARLDAAESREAAQNNAEVTYQSPETVSVASDNSFNPAIGVTFQGQAWAYGNDPEDYSIPGFPLGGEAGPAPEGLSLAETEITMSANVDDKFTAMLTVPNVTEEG